MFDNETPSSFKKLQSQKAKRFDVLEQNKQVWSD